MQITKLEAARRQLVIAIRLFFEDTNSVSVYALAHAAWEVLDALCKHRGLTRFREEMSGANGLSEAEIKRIANYGRNFFKHAKEDPEAVRDDFATTTCSLRQRLITALLRHRNLWKCKCSSFGTSLSTQRRQCGQRWTASSRLVPGIDKPTRKQQKHAGLRFCVAARGDHELMADPSTDRSSVSSID
jgi:hypothetical protein